MKNEATAVENDVKERYNNGEPLLKLASSASLRAGTVFKYLLPANLVRSPDREERLLMATCSQRMASGGQRYLPLEDFQRQLANDGLNLWTYAIYYHIDVKPLANFFLAGGEPPPEATLLLEKILVDYPRHHRQMQQLTAELSMPHPHVARPSISHMPFHELVNLRRQGAGLMQACARCQIGAETAMRYLRKAGELQSLSRKQAADMAFIRKNQTRFSDLCHLDRALSVHKISLAAYCAYYGMDISQLLDSDKRLSLTEQLARLAGNDEISAAGAEAVSTAGDEGDAIIVINTGSSFLARFCGMEFGGPTPMAAVARLEQAAAEAAAIIAGRQANDINIQGDK